MKAVVKGGPQAPASKNAPKEVKSAVKEAPKLLDKVGLLGGITACSTTNC